MKNIKPRWIVIGVIVLARVGGVIRAMNELFPGLGETLEEETSIAIDGVIHEVDYTQPVKPGSEVFFIPRIEGG